MSRIILLDTGPLGYIVHPNDTGVNGICKQWFEQLKTANDIVRVPQIADYELRRELIRMPSPTSIALLNKLNRTTGGVVRIGIRTLQKAAELWAHSRNANKPTCKDEALDGDMILCAQALLLTAKGDAVEIATTNVKHLKDYTNAKLWSDVTA
jgi:hypothetical protein